MLKTFDSEVFSIRPPVKENNVQGRYHHLNVTVSLTRRLRPTGRILRTPDLVGEYGSDWIRFLRPTLFIYIWRGVSP
jgi:hypothetical protein